MLPDNHQQLYKTLSEFYIYQENKLAERDL